MALSQRFDDMSAPRSSAGLVASAQSHQLLLAAERHIESDPDSAALALDGLIARLIEDWYRQHALPVASSGGLLADLAQHDAALAQHVRLALRAPDARARLVHARHLYQLLANDEIGGAR